MNIDLHGPDAWPGYRARGKSVDPVDWFVVAKGLRDGFVVVLSDIRPLQFSAAHPALRQYGFRPGEVQSTERDNALYLRMRPAGEE